MGTGKAEFLYFCEGLSGQSFSEKDQVSFLSYPSLEIRFLPFNPKPSMFTLQNAEEKPDKAECEGIPNSSVSGMECEFSQRQNLAFYA